MSNASSDEEIPKVKPRYRSLWIAGAGVYGGLIIGAIGVYTGLNNGGAASTVEGAIGFPLMVISTIVVVILSRRRGREMGYDMRMRPRKGEGKPWVSVKSPTAYEVAEKRQVEEDKRKREKQLRAD
jgi:hypothetical protein